MTDYAPPKKRSVLIAGHATSISLEPIFWQALEVAARDEQRAILPGVIVTATNINTNVSTSSTTNGSRW